MRSRPAQGQAVWLGKYSISLRANFPNFTVPSNMSPWSNPRLGASGIARICELILKTAPPSLPPSCPRVFPPDASSQTNCSMRFAFTEEPGPLTSAEIEKYFEEQHITLREGQQAEVNLESCQWIQDVGRRLDRGFVLTVDYGHENAELYDERHIGGTLLAYSEHRASEDFFVSPGEQDLTAHVNFTALDVWGRRAGLSRTGCVSQMAFLVALGRANEFADLYDQDSSEVERIRARLLLKSLINPEGMGETFQVFIQHKGLAQPHLTGLHGI